MGYRKRKGGGEEAQVGEHCTGCQSHRNRSGPESSQTKVNPPADFMGDMLSKWAVHLRVEPPQRVTLVCDKENKGRSRSKDGESDGNFTCRACRLPSYILSIFLWYKAVMARNREETIRRYKDWPNE